MRTLTDEEWEILKKAKETLASALVTINLTEESQIDVAKAIHILDGRDLSTFKFEEFSWALPIAEQAEQADVKYYVYDAYTFHIQAECATEKLARKAQSDLVEDTGLAIYSIKKATSKAALLKQLEGK